MDARRLLPLLAVAFPLAAQTPCPVTPTYSPCEMVFELAAEGRGAPESVFSVEMRRVPLAAPSHVSDARLLGRRPPHGDPLLAHRSRRLGLPHHQQHRAPGQSTGSFTAAAAESPGFVRPANVHHWATTETNKPHLWMGDTCYRFGFIDREVFDQIGGSALEAEVHAPARARARRGRRMRRRTFPSADRPDDAYFRELDAAHRRHEPQGHGRPT